MTNIETNIADTDTRVTGVEVQSGVEDVHVDNLGTRLNSIENKESNVNELVLDVVATSLDKCGAGCSDCRKGYYSNFPTMTIYTCVDTAHYMYGNKCKSTDDKSMCSTGATELCHMSFPWGDSLAWNSPDVACRTMTKEFQNLQMDWGLSCN